MDCHKLRFEDVINITLQLLNTLALMEKIGISHLDVKPMNIVWKRSENKVRLIDFGISLLFYRSSKIMKPISTKNISGFTRNYAAPELMYIKGEVIPQKLDVFSFGMTVNKLLQSVYDIRILECTKPTILGELNKEPKVSLFANIVAKCLSKSPSCRPTFIEVREQFFKALENTQYAEMAKSLKYMDETLNVLLDMQNPDTKDATAEDSAVKSMQNYKKKLQSVGTKHEHAESLLNQKSELAKLFVGLKAVSYTHLRAHETSLHLVCRLLLEKKKKNTKKNKKQ
eukprot:TRINITY_DN21095_c0_g1_i1.p1 TRINITY_DN21095_c0_g1~~TRINITY_DN21095_c0_g1_i1.p1  ORF type:complete len:284 (+),score=22.54 TRINITY_DN21095_c0_g1_i1:96-947(+)